MGPVTGMAAALPGGSDAFVQLLPPAMCAASCSDRPLVRSLLQAALPARDVWVEKGGWTGWKGEGGRGMESEWEGRGNTQRCKRENGRVVGDDGWELLNQTRANQVGRGEGGWVRSEPSTANQIEWGEVDMGKGGGTGPREGGRGPEVEKPGCG